jgi:hypothetical protein
MTDELKDQAEMQSDNEQSEVEKTSNEDQAVIQQSEEEVSIEINGKNISLDELKKGYMRQSDYTKKTQEISNLKKQLEPSLPPDKQAIIKELKELGVVTKDDLDRQKSIQDMKMKDDLEIRSLSLTESQESALRRFAAHPENHSKSMNELWDELTGTIGGKVISKKTTIKPKSGSKTGFTAKTSEELAKLPKADYDKYWIDYAASQQAG